MHVCMHARAQSSMLDSLGDEQCYITHDIVQ